MTTTRKCQTLPAEALSTVDQAARRALTRRDVLPARHHDAFWSLWDALHGEAASLGANTVSQLLKDQAKIIQRAIARNGPTQGPSVDREAQHLYRNTLLTVVLAAYLETPYKAATPTDLVPRVKDQRTSEMDRPAADDEITLARTWALLRARTVQGTVAAATYSLCDAGLRLDETKRVQLDDFDGADNPGLVLASGRPRIEPRFIALDEVNVVALAARIAHVKHQGKTSLLHNARKAEPTPGAALVSAINTMNRIYGDLGIDHKTCPRRPSATGASHTPGTPRARTRPRKCPA